MSKPLQSLSLTTFHHLYICYVANASRMCLSTYQVLAPLIVKVPLDGLYLALVSILLGSLPWFGSVKPKQPRISPRATGKKHTHKTDDDKIILCLYLCYLKCPALFLTKPWQVLLLLSLCAVSIDWVHDQ